MKTTARFTTGLNLGNLSLGGGVDFIGESREGVPLGMPLIGPLGPEVPLSVPGFGQGRAGWNASLGYQQRLIGSTTLTPSLSLSSQAHEVRHETPWPRPSFLAPPGSPWG